MVSMTRNLWYCRRKLVRASASCRLRMLLLEGTYMAVGSQPSAGVGLLLRSNVHDQLGVLPRPFTSRNAFAFGSLPERLLPVCSRLGGCAQPEQYVEQFLRVGEIRREVVL